MTATATTDPLVELSLRMGDNALILSHRLSEWIAHAPALEEDLALANVGLDLIGQARLWLGLAGELEGRGRDADALAFLRDARDFRNLLLVELPNDDFAVTMARQHLFDVWHHLALDRLSRSKDGRVADIAAKGIREVAYHRERSREWVLRLGDGTEESHRRMQAALEHVWPYAGEAFEADAVERVLAERGLAPDPAALLAPWRSEVVATLEEATLVVPKAPFSQKGGKRGVHTEHLGFLLAEMQFLQRAYPGAKW